MKFLLGAAWTVLASSALVSAQTYTDCNPLKTTCPADPALGKADQSFDFTSGASSEFTASGTVTYDSTNGATFTISKQGDGPLIQSNWYIMFGRVEYTIKAARGTGIVSSAVLQSDDLDEIDWEWLGGNNAQVQTNYFGKGDTSTYDRGAYHDNTGNHDNFHTYSVDWTSSQVVWAIDGTTVRVLTPSTADTNQYPQTPMMIKVGVWAGGDPSNAQGVIDWAGGETDYSDGPFHMYLKSMTVTDYSTGTSYSYGDQSGTWESITADGGKVNGNSADEPTSTESAPAITSTVDSVPIPWSGTHKETSSFVAPDIWPFVSTGSPTSSSSLYTNYDSGSSWVQPPGGGSVSELSPTPFNTPLGCTTKTGPLPSQSISRFTSASSVSSSAVSSLSGTEGTFRNVTRHATITSTSKTKTRTRTTATETDEFTTGSQPTPTGDAPSDIAPSVGGGVRLHQDYMLFSSICALIGGILALL